MPYFDEGQAMSISADQFNIAQLRAFQAIYKERSVSRAADQLMLTPSAVSHALSKLRLTFDDELFLRTAKGLVPTAKAQEVFPEVEAIIEGIDGLLTHRKFSPESLRGEVRIVVSDYAAFVIVPKFLHLVEQAAPNLGVFLQTWTPRTEAAMESGAVGLALGFRANGDQIQGSQLLDDEFVFAVRADHPLKPVDAATIDQINHYGVAFVAIAEETPDESSWNRLGFLPAIKLKLAHFLAAPAIMQQSDRIAYLPKRIAMSSTFAGMLRVLPFNCETHRLTYSVFWHERSAGDPLLNWLRNLLADVDY